MRDCIIAKLEIAKCLESFADIFWDLFNLFTVFFSQFNPIIEFSEMKKVYGFRSLNAYTFINRYIL